MPPPDVTKCRTCLGENKNQSYYHLDTYIEQENSNILDILDTILPQLKIKIESQLCQQICQDCYDKLIDCHRFHQLCIESNNKLRAGGVVNIPETHLEPTEYGTTFIIKQDLEEEEVQQQENDNHENDMAPDVMNIKLDTDWQAASNENSTTLNQDVIAANTQSTPPAAAASSRAHVCTVCSRSFSSANSLRRHGKMHDPTAPYPCGLCTYRFDLEKMYRRHMLLIHSETSHQFQCPKCPKTFWEKSSLVLHSKSHNLAEAAAATVTEDSHGGNIDIKKETENVWTMEKEENTIMESSSEVKPFTKKKRRKTREQKIFKCKECQKLFASNYNLERHFLLLHDPTFPFVCGHCKCRFDTKERYCRHMFAQHNIQVKDVEPEATKPGTKKDLVSKNNNRNGEEDDQEDDGEDDDDETYVDFVDTGIGAIEKPLRANEKGRYPCDVCGKFLFSPYRLERHKPLHSMERPYACTLCTYRFLTESRLKHHMLKHANPDSQPSPPSEGFQCPNCTRCFESRTSLCAHRWQAHKRKNTESAEAEKRHKYLGQYPCKNCQRQFTTIVALTQHIAKDHPEMEKFKCDQCDKTFVLNALLQEHLYRHRGSQNCVCIICDKVLACKSSLGDHMRTHSVAERFRCKECGKKLSTASSFRQHMERHTDEKKYACPECPCRFKCRVDLYKHSRRHKNLRNHVCDICGLRYSLAQSLRDHKLAKHDGIKRFTCDRCDMSFSISGHLRRHIRTHTGEKPYKCQYCDRAFAQCGDLNKHLRTHVGENIYKCDECPMAFKYRAELRQHVAEEHFKKIQKQQQQEMQQQQQQQVDNVVEQQLPAENVEQNLSHQMSNIWSSVPPVQNNW